jgi:hypothetical protein
MVDEPLPVAGNSVGALRGNDAQWGCGLGLGWIAQRCRQGSAQRCTCYVFAGRAGYLGEMMLRTRRPPSGFIQPCLPSPADHPPSGPGWLHGIKHDGFHMMARRDAAGMRLLTRNGIDCYMIVSKAGPPPPAPIASANIQFKQSSRRSARHCAVSWQLRAKSCTVLRQFAAGLATEHVRRSRCS